MYRCSVCKQPVAVVVKGERRVVVRSCSCEGPIVADMTARVEGRGGVHA